MDAIVQAGVEVLKAVGWTLALGLLGTGIRYIGTKARTERGKWYAKVALQIVGRLEGLVIPNEDKKKQGVKNLASAINQNYPFVKISPERLDDIIEEAVWLTHKDDENTPK